MNNYNIYISFHITRFLLSSINVVEQICSHRIRHCNSLRRCQSVPKKYPELILMSVSYYCLVSWKNFPLLMTVL